MMHGTRNQRIVCAYAILFTVAGGVVAMDLGKAERSNAAKPTNASSVSSAPRVVPVPTLTIALPAELPSVRSDLVGELSAAPIGNTAAVAQRAALPKTKRVAAPGTVYLTARVSKMGESGVHALSPGTAVKLLWRKGDKLKVTDGRYDFDVTSALVTQDPELAETIARQVSTPARFAGK